MGKTYVDKEEGSKRHLLPVRCTDEEWRRVLTWCDGFAAERAKQILSILDAPPTVHINKTGFLKLNAKVLSRLCIDLSVLSRYSYTLKHNPKKDTLKVLLAPKVSGEDSASRTTYADRASNGSLAIDLRYFLISRGFTINSRLSNIPVKYGNLSVEIPVPVSIKEVKG